MSKEKSSEKDVKKKPEKREQTPEEKARGTRETVESIIVAVILAFLFRAFEAEAFVIPTGSMAPTLQGRHVDVACKKCGHRYRAGVSNELEVLAGATCPICRFTMPLNYYDRPNEHPFDGDRILVNKFTYRLKEPERWEVIVFKYPGNAKQNFIKRLVGLPGERVRVQYGNVYVRKADESEMRIARKPPDKVVAMLQLVDDTEHLPDELVKAGWPSRWQAWSEGDVAAATGWQTSGSGREFKIDGSAPGESWLRYKHIVPALQDWQDIESGDVPLDIKGRNGQLITDFYAYNSGGQHLDKATLTREIEIARAALAEGKQSRRKNNGQEQELPVLKQEIDDLFQRRVAGPNEGTLGRHWVGDLAVECLAHVESESGEVLLDLVEGGTHYQCRINVADGAARLSIDGGFAKFEDEQGSADNFPTAATAVKGKGKYRLRFANVDDQLFLWVNNWSIKFDKPTTYGTPRFKEPAGVEPAYSDEDPYDLAPVGVGVKGAALSVSRLRVLRDVYYIAVSKEVGGGDDYDSRSSLMATTSNPHQVLANPESWATTNLFKSRRAVEFPYLRDGNEYFGPDQFFPMGDNSPQSSDARVWSQMDKYGEPGPEPFVDRNLLIGKALLVYWPHTWNRPIPFTPNLPQMRMIR